MPHPPVADLGRSHGANRWPTGVPVVGVRHLQSLLMFLCVVSGYLIRVNMSVAIVAMNPAANSTVYLRELGQHVPTFDWTNRTRSLLLSSFFVGYLLANFPASVLGCRYNNKLLLAGSMTVSSLLAIGSPAVAVRFGAPALIGVRFTQGLFSSFMFPMIHGIMAKWAPPHERGRLVGFVVSGIQVGTMLTLAGSGALCNNELGWPVVFYASGAAGLTWTAVWLLLGAESLAEHRFIGQAERDYIRQSLADTVGHDDKKVNRCLIIMIDPRANFSSPGPRLLRRKRTVNGARL